MRNQRRPGLRAASIFVWFLPLLLVLPAEAQNETPERGGQLRQLRFSGDGKYVLAQDHSEVAVLTVEPFGMLFRIAARDSSLAQFTPDSLEIVFIRSIPQTDGEQREVERWSIDDQVRSEVTSVWPSYCGAEALSSDGRTLACNSFEGTLRVFDVDSGEKVLEKWKFGRLTKASRCPNPWQCPGYKWIGDPGAARLEFSPDGRFLIAIPSWQGSVLVWDTRERQTVKPAGAVKMLSPSWQSTRFVFVTPERLLLFRYSWGKGGVIPARIVEFPDGQVASRVNIPRGDLLLRSADPALVILQSSHFPLFGPPSPVESTAVDLATGQAIVSESSMLDVFGDHYIAEDRSGEIGLYRRGKGLQATVVLHKN